jgi:hypothetical protein
VLLKKLKVEERLGFEALQGRRSRKARIDIRRPPDL